MNSTSPRLERDIPQEAEMQDDVSKVNAAEIAAKLTKAQREALLALSAEYQAGPDLPESCWPELKALQHNGLVERDFADWQDKTIIRDGEYERRLSACWWYRLTPLGQDILQAKEPTDGK